MMKVLRTYKNSNLFHWRYDNGKLPASNCVASPGAYSLDLSRAGRTIMSLMYPNENNTYRSDLMHLNINPQWQTKLSDYLKIRKIIHYSADIRGISWDHSLDQTDLDYFDNMFGIRVPKLKEQPTLFDRTPVQEIDMTDEGEMPYQMHDSLVQCKLVGPGGHEPSIFFKVGCIDPKTGTKIKPMLLLWIAPHPIVCVFDHQLDLVETVHDKLITMDALRCGTLFANLINLKCQSSSRFFKIAGIKLKIVDA